MAAGDASALLIVVLLSFFKQSFEARGWTEDRNPNRFLNRVLARYAYENQRHSAGPEFTFLVTQARRKIVGGNLINLGIHSLPWTNDGREMHHYNFYAPHLVHLGERSSLAFGAEKVFKRALDERIGHEISRICNPKGVRCKY
ncbi:hypothetical protein MTO96_042541 [Rhipicephalus appendiculatus]